MRSRFFSETTPRRQAAVQCPVLCWLGALLLMIGTGWTSLCAAELQDEDFASAQTETRKAFKEKVSPFVKNYCFSCHGDRKQKGGVTFRTAILNPGGSAFNRQWKRAVQVVKTHEMPPDDAEKKPSPEEAAEFERWIARLKFLSSKDPGPFVLRRLTKTELGNTLHDFLGVSPDVVKGLPEEVTGAGYLNSLSPMLMEQYLMVVNEVLSRIFQALGSEVNALEIKLFGAIPPAPLARDRLKEISAGLAQEAFRRPPSEGEIDVLMRAYDLALKNGRSQREALHQMLKAVLLSPQFLFITPSESRNSNQSIVPLDDHQLASRLSYLLWSSSPDAELRDLATAEKLRDPAVLSAQARRLISSPRSRALFDGFGAQWLGVGKLVNKTFDTVKFPEMTHTLRMTMYDEARLFFETILRENLSVETFLTGDFTFLNETLAPIYSMQGVVKGESMRRVRLENSNRGGLLTMPAILAATSFPNRTSPVNRGVWVLEQILGEHVPPPPPNVPSLEKQDPKKVANLTLRQRTEMHRSNPVCASCHRVLDPIGFGLENFDAIGRWRNHDESGSAIDAVGELPEQKRFSSPRELKALLSEKKDALSRTLTGQLLAYALGRQLEGYDELVLDQLTERIAADGYRMQTLVTEVVTSYPFTHRRVHETSPPPSK